MRIRLSGEICRPWKPPFPETPLPFRRFRKGTRTTVVRGASNGRTVGCRPLRASASKARLHPFASPIPLRMLAVLGHAVAVAVGRLYWDVRPRDQGWHPTVVRLDAALCEHQRASPALIRLLRKSRGSGRPFFGLGSSASLRRSTRPRNDARPCGMDVLSSSGSYVDRLSGSRVSHWYPSPFIHHVHCLWQIRFIIERTLVGGLRAVSLNSEL